MIRSLKEIIQEAKKYLKDDFVLEDIYWIIEETLHIQKYEIFSKMNDLFEDDLIMDRIKKAIDVPVAYILNKIKFFSYNFKVTTDTLIPRNETEELVEMVINKILLKPNKKWRILDIGTGSGCIAISIYKELTKRNIAHTIYALDISDKALDVARENAKNLDAKIHFVQSDVFNSFKEEDIDLIVSNPPYIAKENYVAKRVLDNEPHLALFAEEQGLAIYRRIIKDLSIYKTKDLYCEISPELEEGLKIIASEYLKEYTISFYKDLNSNIRFMHISIKS